MEFAKVDRHPESAVREVKGNVAANTKRAEYQHRGFARPTRETARFVLLQRTDEIRRRAEAKLRIATEYLGLANFLEIVPSDDLTENQLAELCDTCWEIINIMHYIDDEARFAKEIWNAPRRTIHDTIVFSFMHIRKALCLRVRCGHPRSFDKSFTDLPTPEDRPKPPWPVRGP